MNVSLLLIIAFAVVVGIQITYYILFIAFFGFRKSKPQLRKEIPVSVLICAKNESENLKKHLPLICNQKYTAFEIVLINDASSDDTLEVMEAFKKEYSNIKVVDVKVNETFWGNKKYALTLGIKAATHEFLVFTDADCKPNSQEWLSHIASKFSNKKSIILGYGAYEKKVYSFLNKLIRFETLLTALQYFSYANFGLPYMGVGRNMAYRKELFFNNSGFSDHMHLKSGDDDLFINKIATKANTTVCFLPESFTISKPKTSFKDWIYQKRRHISTAKHYKISHKLLLSLFFVSQFLFFVIGALSIIFSNYQHIVFGLIVLRYFTVLFAMILASKKLKELDLIWVAPFLELFLILIQLTIFSINIISKPKSWK